MGNKIWSGTALSLLLLLGTAIAQQTGSTSAAQSGPAQSTQAQTSTAPQAEGVERGGYHIEQSVELGYRFTDTSGNDAVYNTFVNLHTGPRIIEQSLSLRSLTNTGGLFDDLFLSSFGWGGDPNDAARLRASKAKWYKLNASFRRDQNYFDYDLLANPLNPPTSKPSIPVNQSPHAFYTVRRMSDVDLTVLPQSRVSFRVGYSHNRVEGPSLSSYHEGTDALLWQPWSTTLNAWRLGAASGRTTRRQASASTSSCNIPKTTPAGSWRPSPSSRCPTAFRSALGCHGTRPIGRRVRCH